MIGNRISMRGEVATISFLVICMFTTAGCFMISARWLYFIVEDCWLRYMMLGNSDYAISGHLFITISPVQSYFSIFILFTCFHITLCLISCVGKKVKTPLSAVATTQVVTSPSESKDGRKEVGGRVGEEKKDKQKSDGREKEAEKRNGREKSSKKGEQKKNSVEKEKDNRESKKRDEKDKQKQKEVEKVEDDKEEGSRKAQNPIVTPVSDEEEIPAKNENKRKDVPQVAAMNPTQEEENENKETEETQATGP